MDNWAKWFLIWSTIVILFVIRGLTYRIEDLEFDLGMVQKELVRKTEILHENTKGVADLRADFIDMNHLYH